MTELHYHRQILSFILSVYNCVIGQIKLILDELINLLNNQYQMMKSIIIEVLSAIDKNQTHNYFALITFH